VDSTDHLVEVHAFNDSSDIYYDFQNENLIRVIYSTLPAITTAYYYFQNDELYTILLPQNASLSFLKTQAAYFRRRFGHKK
jgi:hypothetical protein